MQTLYKACKVLYNLLPAYSSNSSLCYLLPLLTRLWPHWVLLEYTEFAYSFLRDFAQTLIFAWNTLLQILTELGPAYPLSSARISPYKSFQ